MGEDRMTIKLKNSEHVDTPVIDITATVYEMNWNGGLQRIKRQFAATSGELAAEGGRVWINPTRGTIIGIPNKDSKLTKKGWYLAWRDMVSLCSRALQYKVETERQAKQLEDELNSIKLDLIKERMKLSKFDELGEKYTKDMDALMKLLILLGRKIDE